jgi:hypothetical protein
MAKWPYDIVEWKQWLADKRAGKNPPLPPTPSSALASLEDAPAHNPPVTAV